MHRFLMPSISVWPCGEVKQRFNVRVLYVEYISVFFFSVCFSSFGVCVSSSCVCSLFTSIHSVQPSSSYHFILSAYTFMFFSFISSLVVPCVGKNHLYKAQ